MSPPQSATAVSHTPRRGRPSAARAGAIDRTIITAARELFFANGYDPVSMEHVAAKARVSKGTLYARHPSKELLLEAVLKATIAEWSAAAATRDHLLTEDIEQRLRHHARTIAGAVVQPDVMAVQRLIHSLNGRFPEQMATHYEAGFLYIVNLITADLQQWAARTGSLLREPESVARLLVAGITGLSLQLEGSAGREDIDAFAERIVDLLIAAQPAW